MILINLSEANAALNLDEGIGAIYDFLTQAYLHEGIPILDMARLLSLPVPVTSAVKNELKKRGFLGEGSGIRLSGAGQAYVLSELGFADVDVEKYLAAAGIAAGSSDASKSPGAPDAYDFCPITGFEAELGVLKEIYAKRPAVDTSLDQSMCTPETGLRRALLILREGGAVGKKIACVGDDDLVSVALGLVLRAIRGDGPQPPANIISGGVNPQQRDPAAIHPISDIFVFDVDERFLEYISKISHEYCFPVRCVRCDLRDPVPAEFRGAFDAAVTDPPYTHDGLNLFLSRICALLKPEPNKCVYLSYAHKSPQALLEAQKLILSSGCLISRIFPKFNSYVGAQILGGVSDMLVLRSAKAVKPLIAADEPFRGGIYTNEHNRSVRVYICANCGARYSVGHGKATGTIEALKERGCGCGCGKFRLAEKTGASQA